MIYTTYHKGQAQWGSYKDTVRFATADVGNLMLDLMVYALPLLKIFEWQEGRLLSPFLFSRDGKVWPEGMLTRIMRKACALAEVPLLSESHLRQIAAAIVKTKFTTEQRLFQALVNDKRRGGNDEDDEDDGEDEEVAALARMSNHTVRTHNRAYANATGLSAANVWDGLIRKAYSASMLWANFFGFQASEEWMPQHGKRARADGHDESSQPLCKKIALSVPRRRRHWSGHALLQEARRLYSNPRLKWRCVEQERAVCAIANGSMEVLLVLATGMGKSLCFQLPCSLPESRTTVLIVPLIVLTLDLFRRCQELGIDCQEWRQDHQTRASLVFMSMEAAGSEEGRSYLQRLHYAEQLDRIVVEECHLVITSEDFRRLMARLALLRSIPVPFVYLTATLPTSYQNELCRLHFLSDVTLIRAPTRRTNISYEVRRIPGDVEQVRQETVKFILAEQRRLNPEEKIIIFVRTIASADLFASHLQCDSYHSRAGGPEEKAQMLTRWMSREGPICLVGTSGLGAGLDYPHVRWVVHVDESDGLMNFVQESGRAGRDLSPARSVVVLPQYWRANPGRNIGDDKTALHQYLSSAGYRRLVLDGYMDGLTHGKSCRSEEGQVLCDNCQKPRKEDSRVTDEEEESPDADSPTTSALESVVVSKDEEQEQEADGGGVSSEEEANPSSALSLLLREQRRGQVEQDQYHEGLMAMKDCCVMCRVLGGTQWEHTFNDCKQVAKWKFIGAKREIQKQGRGQWMAKYRACYRCGQPQSICSPEVDDRLCQYRDLVMPGTFALFLADQSGDRWLKNEFGVQFESDIDLLSWAGERSTFGGEPCVNGVRVLARLMRRWEG